ncbi:hypothetical protein [Leucobacter komagatae]|uniref:SdpI/YhfL family protein n=1 Tax=Leucobacter komagatae TaxID=55969 RepID=A0A0D0IVE2_9MICO|nr:hypothetical protein [Leucobacter komagatae]KIP53568.1 hypothetical protein SD72_02580 [Leucobacter komagatae]
MWGQLAGSYGVIGFGVLLLWWAAASRRGTLPRQWLLGHRTSLTLSSHDAWVAVNRALAPTIAAAGLGAVGAGVVAMSAFVVRAEKLGLFAFLVGIAWGVIVSCGSVVPGAIASRRYARTARGAAGTRDVVHAAATLGSHPRVASATPNGRRVRPRPR